MYSNLPKKIEKRSVGELVGRGGRFSEYKDRLITIYTHMFWLVPVDLNVLPISISPRAYQNMFSGDRSRG